MDANAANDDATLRRTRQWMSAGLAVWMIAVVVASSTGALAALGRYGPPPVALVTMLAPVVIYAMSSNVRAVISKAGLSGLTAIHVLRVFAVPLFFWYGARGLLPQIFVGRAGWGDLLSGVVALVVVLAWQRPAGYWTAHVIGLLDFLVAFGTAIPLARQNPLAMSAVTGLPMALIPFFAVGVLAATHVMAFHLLLRDTAAEPNRASREGAMETL